MSKSNHGGPGRGQGRHALSEIETVRKTATLPADVFEYLKNLGGGNYSKGCRIAADFHKRMKNTNRDGSQKARRVVKALGG